MKLSDIKFKVFDSKTKSIITDSSLYFASVSRDNGILTVWLDRPELIPLIFTGLYTDDGTEIYEGDLIESLVDGVQIVECIHFLDGAWRFGAFDGIASDYALVKIVGNRNVDPWPVSLGA